MIAELVRQVLIAAIVRRYPPWGNWTSTQNGESAAYVELARMGDRS